MAYSFTAPKRTIIGKGSLASSADYIKELGRKAFIVTGKIVTKMSQNYGDRLHFCHRVNLVSKNVEKALAFGNGVC